jgi:hypothetical protein
VSYYYLIPQLPHIVYGQTSPISIQAFKALCSRHLPAQDALLLEECTLDPGPQEGDGPAYAEPSRSKSAFINKWRDWERALRLNLARFRAQKMKVDDRAATAPPEYSAMDLAAVARTAVAFESPLEAEIFLDQARWNALDSMQGLADYFSAATVQTYLLKLLLIERRASLANIEEGFAEYKGLYSAILAGAPSSVESGVPK